MISFDKINKFDPLYQILNNYFRFVHNHVYYKKIQIIGYKNVPPKNKATFVISNHQNGLMDPLAMLYLFKDHRQPVFIARGDIFKKSNFIAKLLRFLKILPTFRSRDGDRNDIRFNEHIFEQGGRILRENGTLIMYPEAGHQAGKFFSTFKKGFPRICFRAAASLDYQLDFQILPMYIYYTDYFNIRSQQVVVIGKPFRIDEFYELYRTEPNKAFIAMNEKAREAVRSMGIDITDHEHYESCDMICTICRSAMIEQEKWPTTEPYSALRADKKTVALLDQLREEQPTEYALLIDKATEYKAGLQQLQLRDWELNRTFSYTYIIKNALFLLLTFPFFFFGMINNIFPFKASEIVKRKVEDKMFYSSLNFTIGAIVSFPIFYILLFTIVCIVTNWWVALLYMSLTFCLLPFYYEYKKLFIKWESVCRLKMYEREHLPLLEHLHQLRVAIQSRFIS